jgi:cytochrome c oxidase assembly factor 6
MGWLWGSSGVASSTKTSNDGAYEAPDRSKRVRCWDSRDAYFQCLDRNNILDALKGKDAAEQVCGKETLSFEENCASSWVSILHHSLFFYL